MRKLSGNKLYALCAGLLIASCTGAYAAKPYIWASMHTPSVGHAQSIGSAAAGCLMGAQPLEEEGPGWQVLRVERHRNYSHPDTIEYVHWLAAQVHERDMGTLIVGDLSQPRGGPMSSGHGSHQNGVDVDIMFQLPTKPLTQQQRQHPEFVSVVKGQSVNPALWSDKYTQLLEIAASAPQVERIFVNPAIKNELCHRLPKAQRSWLHKLRPWWGHDEHFHVRLSCPPGSSQCTPQSPPPEGDGCGYEVESWLERPTTNLPADKPNTRNVTLPAQCMSMIRTAQVEE